MWHHCNKQVSLVLFIKYNLQIIESIEFMRIFCGINWTDQTYTNFLLIIEVKASLHIGHFCLHCEVQTDLVHYMAQLAKSSILKQYVWVSYGASLMSAAEWILFCAEINCGKISNNVFHSIQAPL